jgi:hypothetical protein
VEEAVDKVEESARGEAVVISQAPGQAVTACARSADTKIRT